MKTTRRALLGAVAAAPALVAIPAADVFALARDGGQR